MYFNLVLQIIKHKHPITNKSKLLLSTLYMFKVAPGNEAILSEIYEHSMGQDPWYHCRA